MIVIDTRAQCENFRRMANAEIDVQTVNRWRTVVSGAWKLWRSSVENVTWRRHERLSVICFVVWPTTIILNIISGLQWRNVNEYRLPSKNAHSPNYCAWLAVCVNCSVNFYCKIALIKRCKLHLVKTYSKTPKNKLNVNKNNVEYILCLHLVNITWRHPGWHYNDTPGDREAVNIW